MADTLNTPLRTALDGQLTPKFLATLNTNGEPNCVPVITIHPYHDGTLVFGEFLMQKTRANLGVCDTVSVAVLDDTFTGWSIKGRFRGFETRGERLDFVNTLPLLRYNAYTGARAAGTIEIIEVSSAISMSRHSVLSSYLRARAVAAFSSRNARRPCMPLQVAEKFRPPHGGRPRRRLPRPRRLSPRISPPGLCPGGQQSIGPVRSLHECRSQRRSARRPHGRYRHHP